MYGWSLFSYPINLHDGSNCKLNIMTRSSISTPYAQRLVEKFRESEAYLRANGFSRSTKTLYEDTETSTDNNTYT